MEEEEEEEEEEGEQEVENLIIRALHFEDTLQILAHLEEAEWNIDKETIKLENFAKKLLSMTQSVIKLEDMLVSSRNWSKKIWKFRNLSKE